MAQSAESPSPKVSLGYKRAELALVPSNRSASEEAGAVGAGASDVPDVLMELYYKHLLRQDAGIYSRLAVGKVAVSQPGAAFLFARDNKGKADAQTAQSVAQAFASMPSANVTATSEATRIRKEREKFSANATKVAALDQFISQNTNGVSTDFRDLMGKYELLSTDLLRQIADKAAVLAKEQ